MNIEQIEFQLTELSGKNVVVVLPSFGKVSFSYFGCLSYVNHKDTHDLMFHLALPSNAHTMMFSAYDVDKLEDIDVDDDDSHAVKVIRLKGPHMPNHAEQWMNGGE